MSRIALGTVQFGVPYGIANEVGQVSRAEAKSILQQAYAHKIDTIDRAKEYYSWENITNKYLKLAINVTK